MAMHAAVDAQGAPVYTVAKIATELGITRQTVYEYLNRAGRPATSQRSVS
jgi:predicted transcriptional regulator